MRRSREGTARHPPPAERGPGGAPAPAGRTAAGGGAAVHLVLEARADNVWVARQAISGVAEALGWPDAAADDLRIAVSEACSNVVMHGYPGPPGPMEVAADLGGGALTVHVSDRGPGPRWWREAPDPVLGRRSPGLGLGLGLMAALSDELTIAEVPSGGSRVRLRFEAGSRGGRP